ncbi:YfgM family protein [Billgrantia antri]|uniref:Ancillary SecYEG translocon subunit n=1 Tax=Billgrantia antri TaxID=2846777 RepID=A0ABS6ZJI3_9GAMM|nr:tetratricopeptide repeat protein [Halomonas antri]
MAELRTEEEQLEAIKRWWKENGTSLIAGVAIAIAGVVGWNTWQSYQDNQAEAASMRYQQLVSLADSDNVDEARGLISEITDQHGRTLYADLARLIDASLAVEEGDLDAARQALEGVIEASDRPYVQGLARLRLARLQVADGEAEAALDTLARDVPASLTAQQADVRGDALRALGRDDEARQAWQEALAVAEQRNQPIYGVQLKLDDLGAEEAML